jgi:hypothetical protein
MGKRRRSCKRAGVHQTGRSNSSNSSSSILRAAAGADTHAAVVRDRATCSPHISMRP